MASLSEAVRRFADRLYREDVNMHGFMLSVAGTEVARAYYRPFEEGQPHRMFSVSKTMTGIAIGMLIDDGKLGLDDAVVKYFGDWLPEAPSPYLTALTIRDMLTMQTCSSVPYWFTHDEPDRTRLYFNHNTARIPGGMRYEYDSAGSQVLSTLVEKLSGMSLFQFLDQRIFRKLGTFRTASILKTKNDDSWGDSAMLCTARDMASFGRFVMNYGRWNGEQILNEAYLREATSPLISNDVMGFRYLETAGYGYQIWSMGEDLFFFNGMGCQLTLCLPKKDLIFAISGDNQGFLPAKALIASAFFDIIVDNLSDTPLPEDPAAWARCRTFGDSLELLHLPGKTESAFAAWLNGKVYRCEPNPTGITRFSLHFTGPDAGQLHYTNAQGDKVLPFGLGKNVFCKFPQYGYSDLHGGLRSEDGFLYDCAVSAAWAEEKKLQLKVQIIDRYFGNFLATFSFREDFAVVVMNKTAEDFLQEYQGTFHARLA